MVFRTCSNIDEEREKTVRTSDFIGNNRLFPQIISSIRQQLGIFAKDCKFDFGQRHKEMKLEILIFFSKTDFLCLIYGQNLFSSSSNINSNAYTTIDFKMFIFCNSIPAKMQNTKLFQHPYYSVRQDDLPFLLFICNDTITSVNYIFQCKIGEHKVITFRG